MKISFFRGTIIDLATSNALVIGGKIYLPWLQCVRDRLEETEALLAHHYTISWSEEALDNPLFFATEQVTDQLMELDGAAMVTNATQRKPLDAFSNTPFVCLTRVV